MIFESKNLGTIEYTKEDLITFDKGILAFEDKKEFVIIRNEETEFYYLQSLEDANITFILIDLKDTMPNYNPEVAVEQLNDLGEINNNLGIYNICTVQDEIKDMTVNLVGPIVVNLDTRKGKQVIVTKDEYSIKHRLFK